MSCFFSLVCIVVIILCILCYNYALPSWVCVCVVFFIISYNEVCTCFFGLHPLTLRVYSWLRDHIGLRGSNQGPFQISCAKGKCLTIMLLLWPYALILKGSGKMLPPLGMSQQPWSGPGSLHYHIRLQGSTGREAVSPDSVDTF